MMKKPKGQPVAVSLGNSIAQVSRHRPPTGGGQSVNQRLRFGAKGPLRLFFTAVAGFYGCGGVLRPFVAGFYTAVAGFCGLLQL